MATFSRPSLRMSCLTKWRAFYLALWNSRLCGVGSFFALEPGFAARPNPVVVAGEILKGDPAGRNLGRGRRQPGLAAAHAAPVELAAHPSSGVKGVGPSPSFNSRSNAAFGTSNLLPIRRTGIWPVLAAS
jgi:hypothetical protein